MNHVAFVSLLALAGCGGKAPPGLHLDMGSSHDLAHSGGGGDMASPICTGGKMNCFGVCTDTMSDPMNCSGCGNGCGMGQSCVAGLCKVGGGSVDMAMQIGGKTGCSGFVGCYNGCTMLADPMAQNKCAMQCFADTTPHGQQLAMAVFTCLDMACPSTNGGVCDPAKMMQAACTKCVNDAQDPMANGACVQQIAACDNDLP